MFLSNYYVLLLSVVFAFCISACGGQNIESNHTLYKIMGNVDDVVEGGIAVVSKFDPVSQVKTPLDTAEIDKDGNYNLNFTFGGTDLYRLDITKKQYAMLVIDKGDDLIRLDITGEGKGVIEVSGSEASEKLQAYERFRLESNARLVKPTYDAMREASKHDDHDAELIAVENYAHASKEHRKELIDFTQKNIGNSIALYGTMLRWTGDDEIDRLESLVSNFSQKYPDLKMTGVMQDKLNRFKRVAIGAIAPKISLADSAGVQVVFDPSGAKYTLIDFWASWCTPCLLQIPDLKTSFAEFHKSGFDILGISIDGNGQRWKNAINKYEMEWTQLSDLKAWGSDAATDYNVTFIPFNILIDSEGKIIAKNLHSKALKKKLDLLLR